MKGIVPEENMIFHKQEDNCNKTISQAAVKSNLETFVIMGCNFSFLLKDSYCQCDRCNMINQLTSILYRKTKHTTSPVLIATVEYIGFKDQFLPSVRRLQFNLRLQCLFWGQQDDLVFHDPPPEAEASNINPVYL